MKNYYYPLFWVLLNLLTYFYANNCPENCEFCYVNGTCFKCENSNQNNKILIFSKDTMLDDDGLC